MSTIDARRLQRLENIEAARATLIRYCRGLDRRDFALLEDVFAEAAVVERPDGVRLEGRAAAMDFFRAALANPIDHRKHYVTNVEAEATGDDGVRLEAYLLVVDQHRGELMLGWGTYVAEVAVGGGLGRFTHLRIGLTMPPAAVKGMLDPLG